MAVFEIIQLVFGEGTDLAWSTVLAKG